MLIQAVLSLTLRQSLQEGIEMRKQQMKEFLEWKNRL
jgi:hypothetical protein